MQRRAFLRLSLGLGTLLLAVSPAWAAITESALTSGQSGVDVTSATTASITITANQLALLTVGVGSGVGTANTPTVTMTGATWVVAVTNIHTGVSYAVWVFRTMVGSDTTATVTIDFAGQTQDRINWSIAQFDAVDTSGTNGSGAIVQTKTAFNATTTAATVTLDSAIGAGNATYGGFLSETSGTFTAGSGYSLIHNVSWSNGHTGNIGTEWRADGQTVVNGTFSGTAHILSMGLEIKAADAGAAPATPQRSLLGVGQ